MDAYVLIQTQTNGEPLAPKLRTILGIVSAEDVYGAYDAIALARSRSSERFIEGIVSDIRKLPGVTHVLPALRIGSLEELPDDEPWDRRSSSRDEVAA